MIKFLGTSSIVISFASLIVGFLGVLGTIAISIPWTFIFSGILFFFLGMGIVKYKNNHD
ncbi:hypothetical protein [Mesonia aestuariivivens]|uniref:Uncharacterized protein n=1 Tax=Mesonia aestuariivivens TaxID=2796128 RepID=A0ABS6W2T4_9FLAO|nr:hypothetical protein [Mesonia aestuariivivens]MBW2962165.1 hypothetical protein [Mesonia aestuariivivens]